MTATAPRQKDVPFTPRSRTEHWTHSQHRFPGQPKVGPTASCATGVAREPAVATVVSTGVDKPTPDEPPAALDLLNISPTSVPDWEGYVPDSTAIDYIEGEDDHYSIFRDLSALAAIGRGISDALR